MIDNNSILGKKSKIVDGKKISLESPIPRVSIRSSLVPHLKINSIRNSGFNIQNRKTRNQLGQR